MKHDPLRSALSSARGLGSSKSGVHHFLVERLTALALVPLGVWFVASLLQSLLSAKPDALVAWLQSPVTAVLFGLFVVLSFVHSASGIQVIIEDYVGGKTKLIVLLLLNKALHIVLGLASLVALFNLHFLSSVGS